MKCSIVKELLPNYMDGLTSEETNADVRKHLEGCDGCRTIYEQLSTAVPREIPPEEKNIDSLRKLKKKILRRRIIVAVSACILLTGFYFFARYYEIPLSFDANRMFVEPVQAVVEPAEDTVGDSMLITLDQLDFEASGKVISGEWEILDLVQFAYKGLNEVGFSSVGKTVNRNGEEIRVVFFCYEKTLWEILFFGDLAGYSESGYEFGDIYDYESYQDGTYEPQMREIYYLPMRNLTEIRKLPEEEFDQLTEKAELIWKGVN